MDAMAWPDGERTLYTLWDSWRGCRPGMPQNMTLSEICALIFIWQVFSPAKVVFAGVGVLLLVCRLFLYNFRELIVNPTLPRQLRMFGQAKTLLSTSSSASKCFSDGSEPTHKFRLPQR